MQNLSKRLSATAALVKSGAVVADVGTDHGYIPVFLVKNGISPRALALDINEGPLNSCKELVRAECLEDRIITRLSNGLDNVDKSECDTIIIAGMGGELIADILSRHSWIKEKHIILQPMTHPELARKFLFDNGFEIQNDIIVCDKKHHYSVFDAVFTNEFKQRKRSDYFLGNIKDFSDKEYFLHLLNFLKNKQKSGEDYSDVISAVEEKL